MNKELEVLYKIFELELSPPFNLVEDPKHKTKPDVFNKHSKQIGWFNTDEKYFTMVDDKEDLILDKIKKVFNVDEISDDDAHHITKHLYNWLRDNFSNEVEFIRFWNQDTHKYVKYPTK